ASPSCATFCARAVSPAAFPAFASRCLQPSSWRRMCSINSSPRTTSWTLPCEDDAEIQRTFLAAPLSTSLQEDLKAFLAEVKHPLAVRSSSLLEDSQYQPFTGVYETFMLGNQEANAQVDPEVNLNDRLTALSEAIRRIYASTFSRHAKAYVRATPYRLEEEKMAIILQQVVGTRH